MFIIELLKNKKLFLTYLLIFASLFFLFFLSSCSVFEAVGLGKVASEERQVSGIESISIGSSMNLVIEQTGSESIRIEATENIIPDIITEVVNRELQISLKPVNFTGIRPINCFVSVKDLNAIKVSSSATVKCDNLKTENLSVEMASSSKGSLTVDVTNLDLKIASSANLTVSGKADSQTIRVNSSGKLDAFELVSKDCKIEVQSSGSANINVSENLDANVHSAATLNYKGSPKVNSDVSSSGSLNKISN
ncbi:MAG: DUF2807 domain-containing protein [Actinobacteria bacterium]|nr:DUF2807 domain-containing protein [Actinomycetota bacterium]